MKKAAPTGTLPRKRCPGRAQQHGPINDAQRRLYDGLLRSVDREAAEAEAAERGGGGDGGAVLSLLEEETPEQKAERERAREDRRRALRERIAEAKRRREEEERLREERVRLFVRRERERKRMGQEEERATAIRERTRAIARLDGGLRREDTGNTYFGDALTSEDAWIPHGQGQHFSGESEVLYEGGLHRGKMHGDGLITLPNGDAWAGRFHMDELHGVGAYSSRQEKDATGDDSPIQRHVIYSRNRRVCSVDDLTPGVYIEFRRISSTRSKGAVILDHTKKPGHFIVKLDNGSITKIDLASVEFEITSKADAVPLDRYVETKYKRLPRNLQPRPYAPIFTSYDENLFSNDPPNAEEQRELELMELRKENKELFEEHRRKAEEEAVQRMVEEEVRREREKRAAAELAVRKGFEEHQEELKRQREALAARRERERVKIMKSREKIPEAKRSQEG